MIHSQPAHVGLALLEVQSLNMMLLPLVNVDCPGVDRRERAREVDFADYSRSFGFINDDEIIGRYSAQADGVGRIRLIGPVPEFTAAVKKSGLDQMLIERRQIHVAETFA